MGSTLRTSSIWQSLPVFRKMNRHDPEAAARAPQLQAAGRSRRAAARHFNACGSHSESDGTLVIASKAPTSTTT